MTAKLRSIIETTKSQYSSFQCGHESLNNYIKQFAKGNHRKGIGKTYVLFDEKERVVAGYYTISSGLIDIQALSDEYKQGLPKYPIPSAHLGRLAVDERYKGKGYGGELLSDALLRIWEASKSIAIYAVTVDAIDISAKDFYLHYDFIPFQNKNPSMSLFLPITTISELFEN